MLISDHWFHAVFIRQLSSWKSISAWRLSYKIPFSFLFLKHYYYFNIYIYFCHLRSHHSLNPPIVLSPYPTSLTNTFLIAIRSINHCRHHTNYATEPPTVSTIFSTRQVSPVNVSNIFSIVNNYKHYFSTLMHCEPPPVLSKQLRS